MIKVDAVDSCLPESHVSSCFYSGAIDDTYRAHCSTLEHIAQLVHLTSFTVTTPLLSDSVNNSSGSCIDDCALHFTRPDGPGLMPLHIPATNFGGGQ
jgi:hypothetical protein